MWERRAEMGLFVPSIEYGHHTHPMFIGRLQQYPDWARTLVPKAERVVDLLADQLDRSQFVAGDELSIADFTAFLGYFGLIAYGALQPSAREGIGKWSQMMLSRRSMAPLRQAAEFLQSAAPAQGVQA